jgi:hypothetical protein
MAASRPDRSLTAKGGGGIILAGKARLSGICLARCITRNDDAITW